jgi:hypothetical protein
MASYLDSLADLLRKGSDTLVNLPTEAQRFFTNPQAFTEVVTGKNLLPKETGFVAGATGLPPKNPVQGGALNPAAAPYQEGYEQGEPVAIASMAVPAYAGVLRAGAPKVYNALENYMVKSGGMIPLEAYHGTPHKIEGAFDIKKMGTGEGAQAYGPGMYFAENPNVAIQYKNILSKPEFTKTGQGMELRGQLPRMLDESYSELVAKNGIQQTNYGDVTDIVGQRLDRQMKDALKANDMDWYNKTADMKMDLARFRENPPPNTGNLYKVDIPDEYIPNMLDWDKPLKDQTKILEGILSKNSGFTGQTKREIQKLVNKNATGGELFELFGKDQKELADELAKLGVPGVRYLDEGSRNLVGGKSMIIPTKEGFVVDVSNEVKQGIGGFPLQTQSRSPAFKTKEEAQAWADKNTKQGTSNFVVFEPSKLKILEENSKPVSRKALIEEQVKKLKD